MSPTVLCPCGSTIAYEACCGRYHNGIPAPTAEALMCSRYSAYSLKLVDYLRDTWHPATRSAKIEFGDNECNWCGLDILSTKGGSAADQQGEVEFVAYWFLREGTCGSLHERSRFVQEGRWYYIDGELFPTITTKVGRNDPCPCNSGKKFKQCCGR